MDDDPDVLEGTALVLKQHGWQVAAATTPDSAMDALVTLQAEGQMPEGDMPCALISDHRLQTLLRRGINHCSRVSLHFLQTLAPALQRILITSTQKGQISQLHQ